MIPKSGDRFSEKIMPHAFPAMQQAGSRRLNFRVRCSMKRAKNAREMHKKALEGVRK
jgi:hypothetical protein